MNSIYNFYNLIGIFYINFLFHFSLLRTARVF